LKNSSNSQENSVTASQTEDLNIMLKRKKSGAWVNAILPFNIAIGPIGTLVQLLILNLRGTVIDVALALALFNAVGVPSALIWGFITDRLHRRKPIIAGSYLAAAGILLSFLFANSGYLVSLLYAAFSFITSASTTPLNLLIMETESKQKWATAFASFSMITSVGQTVGLFLSVGLGFFISLKYLVLPLAALSIISAALSLLMIKEPNVVFERQMIVLNKPSFFSRILAVPFFFLRVPHLNDFKRIFRNIKYELTRHVPILYFSIFMFYLASGIFNTSLVPSLQANNISGFLIFFVTTIGMIIQVISFKYAGPYTEKRSPVKAAVGGLALRSLAYGSLGVSVLVIPGVWFLAPVLIFYPIAAGIAYSVYYTASNTMVFNTLRAGRQGSSLGVYSALVGIATLLGSLVSGFASFFLGFSTAFLIAAGCLGFSAWLASLLKHHELKSAATE
jgi:MFS family permease